MAHHLPPSGYGDLINRLNRVPQGAPPSRHLNGILKILFTEQEANLVSLLPIRPFTVEKAASIWKKPITESRTILEDLASRALLVDIQGPDVTEFVLPPPMAGFFEFSLMRIRKDIDQKMLSQLFYQYLNEEEEFIRNLFTDGETQLGRVFVHEPVLTDDNMVHVLDYEMATRIIESATHRAIGMCYCRHKMEHVNKACTAPMDICMTFNTSAASLIKHGHAREVNVTECLDLLATAHENSLVQFGENVQERVNFICNCCGCCCEAMLAAQRFSFLNPVHTTNFIPELGSACIGCGKCVMACPVKAIALVTANDPQQPKRKQAKLDDRICLGCGVCVRQCSEEALTLKQREERVITPLNSIHRMVLMAIDRGKLAHLLFDNRVLFHHRALAAVFNTIFQLPPVKQILASKQIQSRYLEAMITRLAP